jgi:hypothetical protein
MMRIGHWQGSRTKLSRRTQKPSQGLGLLGSRGFSRSWLSAAAAA